MPSDSSAPKVIKTLVVITAVIIMYSFLGVTIMFTGGMAMFIYTLISSRGELVIQLWQFTLFAAIDLFLISTLAVFVFKSKLPEILKVIYLALPLVYLNMALQIGFLGLAMSAGYPAIASVLTGLIIVQFGVAVYLIGRFQLSWLYYIPPATILVIKIIDLIRYLIF